MGRGLGYTLYLSPFRETRGYDVIPIEMSAPRHTHAQISTCEIIKCNNISDSFDVGCVILCKRVLGVFNCTIPG